MKKLHFSKPHYSVLSLLIALFSGMLAHATTNNDLDLLKGKVETARVIQKTKQEQNNVLDVSDKFKKSRDFLAMQTPVDTIRTAEEAKRVYEEGLRLQEKFQGVAEEDYEQVLAEQGMTLESFHNLIKRLNQAQTYFVNEANDEGHWRQKQGKNYKYIAKSSKEAQAGYIEMGRKINQLIHNLYGVYKYLKAKPQRETQKKQLAEARAGGVVHNIAEIKEGSKLDSVIKKLQITFKTDDRGVIALFIDNKPTNFKLFKPTKDKSYTLMSDGTNSVIIEKLKINGKKYLAKFALEDRKIIQYGAYEGKQLHKIDSFELSQDQQVSYNK